MALSPGALVSSSGVLACLLLSACGSDPAAPGGTAGESGGGASTAGSGGAGVAGSGAAMAGTSATSAGSGTGGAGTSGSGGKANGGTGGAIDLPPATGEPGVWEDVTSPDMDPALFTGNSGFGVGNIVTDPAHPTDMYA